MAVKYKAGRAFPIGATNKEAVEIATLREQSAERVGAIITRFLN